ncbi:MAG: PilZ domain-containing protein [Desulfobulbus sp.]
MLVKDGLFLPVPEHIAAYCTSQYYLSCHHYQLLANLHDHPPKEDQRPINRRRSIRIPRYHLFRFSELSPNKQTPETRQEETWTIDVSEHGIRFASYRYLAPDTLIRFSLEGENRLNIDNGQARVVWSEPLENTPLFHAGIAFSE